MHPDHQSQLGKLNRAIGQMEAVRRMIEERSYCVDIMTQLRAARSALKNVELGILETHLHTCVSHAAASNDAELKEQRIGEIIKLLKKYE